MKPSELKKNFKTTITMNRAIKDELDRRGLSAQKVFDEAINKLLGDTFKVVRDAPATSKQETKNEIFD